MYKIFLIIIISSLLSGVVFAQDKTSADYYQLAMNSYDEADFEAALKYLDQSLAADSVSEKALYLKAYILHDGDRLNDALSTYDRLLQINPVHEDGLYNRGLLKMTLNDFDGARADYDQSIALNAQDPDLFMKRAYCRQLTENLVGAIDDYSSAIQLDSTLLEAYASRGAGKITMILLKEDEKPTFKRTKSACEDLFIAQPLDDPIVKDLLSKYCPRKRKNK